MLYNPTNIDVDRKGRVWVVEAVDYRSFNNPDSTRLSHPQGERIRVLEDTDGDGRADRAKTFVQDEDLISPLGIGVIGNKVVVSASPSIVVYTDTDGDLEADRKDTLLTGFGGIDHDHGVHAVKAGPDGRFYFNVGNAGPHIVTDQSGWTLRSGSVMNGGSPYISGNQPGLVSDDGRVWTGGLALRVNPDGRGLKVMAHNFRNPYGMVVDSYGRLWSNDNDGGAQSCRILWVMEGANTGYFSADGSRKWRADRRPGQNDFEAQWHQDDPGVIPAGDRTGAGAPTGLTIYEGDALGERFRGMVLSADAGRNVIFGYRRPTPKGAGFSMGPRTYFASSIPDSTVKRMAQDYRWWSSPLERKRGWFRPSDVAVGPSGAIYVADWYDGIVGGHKMQDSAAYGRIYRIAPEDRDLRVPKLDLSTTAGQLQALKSPAQNVRVLGFRRLEKQGEAVVGEVKDLLDADNPYYRTRAVWLLAQLGPAGVSEIERLLEEAPSPELRVTAFRALKQVKGQAAMLLHVRQAARDASPAMRREAAIFLRDVPLEESREAMLALARRYEADHRWELEAFGLAAEGEETAVYELLRARLDVPDDPAAWDPAFADLAWRLHPEAAVEAFRTRAQSKQLSEKERERALAALAFVTNRPAVEAMEALVESSLDDVSEKASWWLDFRRTNEWHDLKDWKAGAPESDEERERQQQMQTQEAKVTNTALPVAERREAVRALSENAQGSRRLLRLAMADQLPDALGEAVRDSLFESSDQTVRVLARRFLDPLDEQEQRWSAERIAHRSADAQKGRTLFYTTCAVCHRVGQTGGEVGPDLTHVENKFDPVGLVSAIIDPDEVLAHGYSPWQVTTTGGEVMYGFLLSENEQTLVLKDDKGQRHVIEKSRLAGKKRLNASLMPGPGELRLSKQDVADIAAFLSNAGRSSRQ